MSWPLTLSSVMAAVLREEPFTLRSYCQFEESAGHRGGWAQAEKDNNRIKDKE